MILQTKDILHPLNVTGLDCQSIKYEIMGSGMSIPIIWSGDYLSIRRIRTDGLGKLRTDYQNGNMSNINYHLPTGPFIIYFVCINVTYLRVNGTVLI